MAKVRDRHKSDETGKSLAEQIKRLARELKKARKRKVARGPTPGSEAIVKEAEPTDEEMFRDATNGAASLANSGPRVVKRMPKLATADLARSQARAIDPMSDEYFDIRFSDLFIRGRAAGVSRETLARLERGEFAVRFHVDLHGMAFDDAKDAVDRFLADRQKRGDRCVLVVTGKGRNSPGQIAVLRERIPEWLARGPSARRVLAFVTARPCDGGEGALYVLLRKNASRKSRIDVEAGGGK